MSQSITTADWEKGKGAQCPTDWICWSKCHQNYHKHSHWSLSFYCWDLQGLLISPVQYLASLVNSAPVAALPCQENTCSCHNSNSLQLLNRSANWTGQSTLSQTLNTEATAHSWYAKGLFFFNGDKNPQNTTYNTWAGQRTKGLRVLLCPLTGLCQFASLRYLMPSYCKGRIHLISQYKDCTDHYSYFKVKVKARGHCCNNQIGCFSVFLLGIHQYGVLGPVTVLIISNQ